MSHPGALPDAEVYALTLRGLSDHDLMGEYERMAVSSAGWRAPLHGEGSPNRQDLLLSEIARRWSAYAKWRLCPKCGGDLIVSAPVTLDSLPPQSPVVCVFCGWTGTRRQGGPT